MRGIQLQGIFKMLSFLKEDNPHPPGSFEAKEHQRLREECVEKLKDFFIDENGNAEEI